MKLELKNVELYLEKNHVLKNINLYVKAGEFISILGKSGCGKTSLIKSIAGFNNISQGDILLDNKSILKLAPHKRNTVIVFQDLRLFPHMNVENNIIFSMKLKKIPNTEIKKRLIELLEWVQLEGFEKRKIYQLSGGQMQRVAIARALAANPDILLLDEPFSGLDEALRKDMGKLVKKLHKRNSITTIMITHDKEEAMQLSDKIAFMQNGEIIEYGSPKDLFLFPKSKITAEFMGEVNYFNVEVKNGKIISELGEFITDKKDGKYELMLRPSSLNISKEKNIYKIDEILYKGEYVNIILSNEKKYIISMNYNDFASKNIAIDNYVNLSINKNIDNLILFER